MALIRCPECGKEISSKAESCPNCGCPQSAFNESNIPRELPPEEWPELFQCYRCGRNIPVGSSACPFCGYTYGTIQSVEKTKDISETYKIKNKTRGKGFLILAILGVSVFFVYSLIMAFFEVSGKYTSGKDEDVINEYVSDEEDENVIREHTSDETDKQKQPVKNVEVVKEELFGTIEDFSYEISGDSIILDDYNGTEEILEIKTSYTIDEKEYITDISEFQVGIVNDTVKTLILAEGFTEVDTAIFNSSDVQNVFFPKSMINVYDATLAYLDPEENGVIKIYYAGTQEEWEQIFTEYKRMKVEDAEFGEEMGTAIADKINEMIGFGYDSSLFEYYFSANADELK